MKSQLAIALLVSIASAQFAEAARPRLLAAQKSAPQKADVEAVKERYWTKGEEGDTGVVQNRLYSKAGKFEIGLFGGMIDADPFLDINTLGGSVGYHFSEFVSLRALAWKSFTSTSSAYDRLRAANSSTNLNELRAFYGAELGWSPIYGKLSFLGNAIIYYDLHLLGGGGLTKSENGTYLTGIVGIGQQFYVNNWMSLTIDYRLMPFTEDEVEEVQTLSPNFGKVIGQRTVWSNSLTLGVTFLIGG